MLVSKYKLNSSSAILEILKEIEMNVSIIRQGISKPSVDKIPELEKLMLPISDIFSPKEKVHGKGFLYDKNTFIYAIF